MGLTELKGRAYEHITKSITSQTVALEIFGPFAVSATEGHELLREGLMHHPRTHIPQKQFTEIQDFERRYLLQHWSAVRQSSTMKDVLERVGSGGGGGNEHQRYPGFTEVLVDLMGRLDVVPGVEPASR